MAFSDQKTQRRKVYLKDQFGRKWWAIAENSTGQPTTGLKPFQWTAPLSPPWLRGLFVPDGGQCKIVERDGEPLSVEVKTFEWMAMQEQALQHYDQRAQEIALKSTANYLDMLKNPTPEFTRALGPKPFPPMDVLQGMQDEDPWVLGFTDTRPHWCTEVMLRDMLYAARAGGLLRADVLREIRADERRERMGGPAVKRLDELEGEPTREKVARAPRKRDEKGRLVAAGA